MADEFTQKFRETILKALEAFQVEGVSAAVIKEGETILLDGFGYADRDKQLPMTAGHVLPIASTSKAFTATSVALLADEGKLDLDRPVREYMPGFGLKDPAANNEVTARDLLCHRTGLPRHDLLWITWPDIPRDDLIFERVRHLPPNKPFRSVWQYQNHMYAAAGCLVERISGKSWEDFVRARIFEPLNMKTSSFGQDEKDPAQAFSVLYKKNKEGKNEECQPESVACVGPAGSIRSTARDMVEWLKFNLSGGKAGETALIGEATFAELHRPNIPYQLFPFEIDETHRMGYGLGWFVDCYRGEKVVHHGGNVSGASILVSMIPEKKIGCVFLANQDGTFMDYALSYAAFDLLLGHGEEKDWIGYYKDKQKILREDSMEELWQFVKNKLPEKPALHELQEYCGKYEHPAYGEIRVFSDEAAEDPEAKLRLDVHGNVFPLIHLHYDIFYTTIHDIPLPASFKTGVDGKLESLSVRFEFSIEELMTFRRVPEEKEEKLEKEEESKR